jgi:hypothetical protein
MRSTGVVAGLSALTMRFVLWFALGSCTLVPSAAQASVAAAATRHCGAFLNVVGLNLTEAHALAKRCGQPVSYVWEVPNEAPPGTVVSESLPGTGNRLVVSTGPLTDPWGVLRGAKGPPVERECTATIQLSEDGNARPLTCYGTHVNVEAWDFYAALRPAVMRLPRNLSTCQVVPHLVSPLSIPENISAFVLANVYNGWHVPIGFVQHALNVGTPNHDTCPHA